MSWFSRKPEADVFEPDDDETELDRPTFLRTTGEYTSGLRSVHLAPRPLEWTTETPLLEGFYLVRPTGAPRIQWKVLDVWRGARGVLLAGWTDIDWQPIGAFKGLEWCHIQEPS